MPRLAFFLFALLAVTGCATARETTVPLFNGKDLTGWTQHGGKATYSVENGFATEVVRLGVFVHPPI